jgi:oxepin-CoA hydrolase/3-oxo-5,6-dehydrosuberyl-CoA semialdehyde dehydrogenase
MKTQNYIMGRWLSHDGSGEPQYDAVNGDLIATCSSEGLDFAGIMDYARKTGGSTLRKMTFRERGLMLKKLALYLHGIRKKYYPLSFRTGATKGDSWIDIDGGIGTLFAYASLRRQFPDEPFYVDGQAAGLSKEGTFIGHHIMVPKRGVAIHINAFNFPIWGMLEKISVNLLAGVPCVVKPSELTSFLTEAMVKDIIESKILPEGALQLVCGKGVGILDPVTSQDVVTFTGSASTGKMLKQYPSIIENAVPFNMEADSLNAAVLGEDAVPGTPTFDLFIREVRREITVKCGQKCTAIRRVIVPEALVEDVQIALGKSLSKTVIGDPTAEGVKMGALVAKSQQEEVRKRVQQLSQSSSIVIGDLDNFEVNGADKNKGAFFSPIVFLNEDPFHKTATHEVEAFGPVSTIMPYRNMEEAVELANMGKGSLVSTIATASEKVAKTYVMESAPFHGRILVLNEESAKESTGHGSPMPLLSHGGPGRAGGGEEMGGVRGVKHYLQRTALQGHPTMITALTNQYQVGGKQKESRIHPFMKYYEELEVGDCLTTAKHTVTDADIINFANV